VTKEEVVSQYKFSSAQRYAIFLVHGMKCYLCGVPLDLISMAVDHVLPEHLLATPSLLDAAKSALGLPASFDLTPSKIGCRHVAHATEKRQRSNLSLPFLSRWNCSVWLRAPTRLAGFATRSLAADAYPSRSPRWNARRRAAGISMGLRVTAYWPFWVLPRSESLCPGDNHFV
jgi:hypothetical protein